MQNKILLSYREGCSGSWLAELLVGSNFNVFYRQDLNGKNIPADVYHFDGNHDDQVHASAPKYSGQTCVTCHSTNYQLLRHYWPNHKIVRIQPQTHILDSIESAYNKLKIEQDSAPESVDLAFEYIKDYYYLHTAGDPLPSIENSGVIDYGQLRYADTLATICKETFEIDITSQQLHFAEQYWNLQNGRSEVFKIARYIYEYEKLNSYKESDRLWSISDVPDTIEKLIDFMKYNRPPRQPTQANTVAT
jgi:hypothetical protein